MEEYKLWQMKASDDLNWTKHNVEAGVYYGACFTAHQTIEKALKSFILFKKGSLRKIHDLRALLEDCVELDSSFEELREKVITVIPYYIETRYPLYEDVVIFTKTMAEEAYAFAKDIVIFVDQRLPSDEDTEKSS